LSIELSELVYRDAERLRPVGAPAAPADTDLVDALARAGIPLEAIATEIGPTESDHARLRPGPRGGEDRRPVPGPAASPT
jgi:hypothetical protein